MNNPADRDNCMQYMIAILLILGRLASADYEDNIASDDQIDILRDKMSISETLQFTKDILDPSKRFISNALAIELDNGPILEEVVSHILLDTNAVPKKGWHN